MKKKTTFAALDVRHRGYQVLFAILAAVVLIGLGAAYHMEHNGHWVTGMSNQIVWGMPHVFAVFLIVAASGALNIASIGSVFGKTAYKPLGRLSGLLAIALLAGGLAVLVLDLGRPDRLVVAMTTYNFKSIFAWNVLLYTGFFGVVALYLWMMMDKRNAAFAKPAGFLAFLWRLILTTGTGSIFGFLVARQGYDAAVMAPLFIAMSFAFGAAFFVLVMLIGSALGNHAVGPQIIRRLGRLLGLFAAAVLYFVIVQHLTNLYATEHHAFEGFILSSGNTYSILFWLVQIALGTLLPMVMLLLCEVTKTRIVFASLLVILGGLAQVYVIIIGGQAFPLLLFPGMEVSSSFFDGQVASYTPSLAEVLLGLGGIGIAMILVLVGAAAFRFFPTDLSDAAIDPHVAAREDKKADADAESTPAPA